MMKLGFVISMYDEIDIVKETIKNLKNHETKIVVIQSDPGNENLILEKTMCDVYEKMSDLSGSRENYAEMVKKAKEGETEMIGPIALTRNFNRGYSLMCDFDVDYVVSITGDTKISNLKGILEIIEQMEKSNKIVGGTRSIGYTMHDEHGNFTQFQNRNSTNIMPQFFLANIKAVRKGLFCNTKRTNKHNTEQCFGDEIARFAKENNLDFFEIFYRISDYGYPRYVKGVEYNPEQLSKIPPPFEGIINWIRYRSDEKVNNLITKIFHVFDNRIK